MAFPVPPKSALFSRLEAFLPVLAQENKKVEEAIACGQGDRYNIEALEPDHDKQAASSDDKDAESDEDMEGIEGDDNTKTATIAKPPVIEMNFALGLMGDVDDADDSSDASDDEDEIDLAKTIALRKGQADDGVQGASVKLNLAAPKPASGKPLIQELN